MSARIDRWAGALAAALALGAAATVVVAALIWAVQGFPPLPTSFARGPVNIGLGMVTALCYVGAGWLLASRMWRNPIGWLLLMIGMVYAVMAPTALLVDAAHGAFRPAPPATLLVAWMVSSFSAPLIGGFVIVAGLLFPDGRLDGSRGWRAVVLALVGAGLVGLAGAIDPAGLVWYPTLPNPYAAPAFLAPVVSSVQVAGALVLVAAMAVMALSMGRRYRRGDATVRAQMRWIVSAAAVLPLAMAAFILVRFIVPVGEGLGEVVLAIVNVAIALLPIAAAFAITRYHLFGINVIIGRTLVYVPLMAILGGMYTASVAIFQRIFVAVTGESSDVPLVITIFLVAAAFTPVRKGLEGAVDRWVRRGSGGEGVRPPDRADPAIAQAAAELIALRRLEERVAAGQLRAPGASGVQRRLPINAESRVACPAGGDPHFLACLGCRYFDALVTAPPEVVCTRPASKPS